jgi:ubiquinone/menaquinone biosynthesis C-methylase UbiE
MDRSDGDMSSKDYFDQVASQWDAMRTAFFSEAVRETACAVAGIKPGQLAADIGAGSGFITEGLLQRGVRVIAVDQSQAMLSEMRRKFAGANLDLRLGEAESLPLDSASVDAVFANMYLHHVEHPALAISEMARLLKPGGRLVITDLDEHDFEFLRTEQYDRWLGFRRADLSAWLEQAGLVDWSVDGVGENCSAGSNCGSQTATVSIFVACGAKPGL